MNLEPKTIAALIAIGIVMLAILYTGAYWFCRWAFAPGEKSELEELIDEELSQYHD